jgi:type III secretion protein N (ATPase)
MRLAESPALRPEGRVRAVVGMTVRIVTSGARVGDVVEIVRRGSPLLAEIVGFDRGEAVAVPLGDLSGTGPDDPVRSRLEPLQVAAGRALLGRVLDGLGQPIDGRPLPEGLRRVPVDQKPPEPLRRRPVDRPLCTGVRSIDALVTLGVGQRMGLFSGPGMGKTSLLGSMARGTNADVVVVALVGERGREVNEFLHGSLGESGLLRSVVVAATSDAPALQRLRAAQVATALAEHFRDEGQDVLLLVDSLTRVARAQREVGLAAGEPPVRRGFPPSVFAMLPRLLERSGQADRGSITGIYAVLVEGEAGDDPIAEEVRAILDGHIVLDSRLAARGHYPAIDPVASLSRVMDRVADRSHVLAARRVRALVAAYEERRDLIVLGAYAPGSDARVDRAVAAQEDLGRFLQQAPDHVEPFPATVAALGALSDRYG